MKNNIIRICLVFIAAFTIITAVFCLHALSLNSDLSHREDVVALNEIEALADQTAGADMESASGQKLAREIHSLQDKLLKEADASVNTNALPLLLCIYLAGVLFIILIFSYIYFMVIKPFDRLQSFAGEVAGGNFDSPLYYERRNLFGAFTWAFDNMRKEVKKARACEKEAIESNKTVIATISHDIKTPIASIRAYSEGLQANMDTTPERRQRYLSVIISKCDEVSRLTNDLFLHSLSDLDKLQVNTEVCQAGNVTGKILDSIRGENPLIHILNEIPDGLIRIDIRRLEQVFENLIGNAAKYAPGSRIDISFQRNASCFSCHIRDYGDGIADEDMPFIFDKFYRGRNSAGLPGAGLGLYIAKYILGQMDADLSLVNRNPGLEAVIEIPFAAG